MTARCMKEYDPYAVLRTITPNKNTKRKHVTSYGEVYKQINVTMFRISKHCICITTIFDVL